MHCRPPETELNVKCSSIGRESGWGGRGPAALLDLEWRSWRMRLAGGESARGRRRELDMKSRGVCGLRRDNLPYEVFLIFYRRECDAVNVGRFALLGQADLLIILATSTLAECATPSGRMRSILTNLASI